MEEQGEEAPLGAPPDRVEGSREGATLLKVACGVAGLLALVVGLAVGLTVGRSSWTQPAAPRRAFTFQRFQSCAELEEMFNAKLASPKDLSVRADSGMLYPAYHSDYCEYCDCSSTGEDYHVYGEPMMMVRHG